jgi:LPXTG-site transpeptidase (sortase) family protein
MRKRIGLLLYVVGGLVLSFAIGRYGVGLAKADDAREAWDAAEGRMAVAMARSAALHHGMRETPVDGAPVARLVIPRLDLDEIVLEGVDADDLNAEPGHVTGSAYPGEAGNAVISAHRDRHFNHLDALDLGDTIVTESGTHQDKWVVVSKRVVGKNDRALFRTADATLTLTTCWPIRYLGPAPERLIITAKPIRAKQTRVASAS